MARGWQGERERGHDRSEVGLTNEKNSRECIWAASNLEASMAHLDRSGVIMKCDRFSCLYNLQMSHTVSELKIKFGDNDSVGRMKQLVHVYFGRLFE